MATTKRTQITVLDSCFIIEGLMIPKNNIAYASAYELPGETGVTIHLKDGPLGAVTAAGYDDVTRAQARLLAGIDPGGTRLSGFVPVVHGA